MSEPIYVSAMAPFAAPSTRLAPHGANCAEIVEMAYATRALDRAWDDALHLYVGDAEIPRALWAKAKPRPGALVALRPRARYTFLAAVGSWFVNYGWAYLVEAAAYAATAYGISTLTAADPDTLSFDPRFSIDGARNELRPHASWNAVLGTHRVFPPHAARQFTRTDGEKVWLHLLLSLGLGPIKHHADSNQIGDTPLANFAGATWAVKEKPGDPIPAPWNSISPDEDDGPGLINESDGWINRTIDADDAHSIEFELAWLEGLVRITAGGKRDGITIQLRARYRAVGEGNWREFGNGAATGDGAVSAEGNLIEITGKTELPFRKAYRRSGLTAGQYEIGVKRVEPDYDNPNIRTKFGWMKIRSFTNSPSVIDDNLALLAVTIESGPQANNTVDQVNCIITRVAPVWDAEEEAWVAGEETSNPAALTRWIARGPGMARPYGDDEISDAEFGAWYELCVAKDWRCDLDVRAGSSADPEEMMQTVARCGRASIGRRSGKLVPVLDTLQDAPSQLFTPRNSWGLTARRVFPPKTQAYRVQFNNAEKNYVLDEMTVYFPGFNAENITLPPELLHVTGKTRAVEVYREAKRRVAELLLRGMDYTFRTDWEHFATARGKRVAFAHWEVAVGRAHGRVTALSLNEAETRVEAIEVDEAIEQTLGDDYAISWRRVNAADGNPAPAMTVEALGVLTTPGVSHWIELAAEDGIPIASAPKVGDLITFGDADIQTLDLVVGHIRRGAHYEAEIGAVAYVPALYDDDDAPEPEWSSNVSGDAFPAPPAPEIYAVSPTGAAFYAGFDFPAGTAHRVRSIEAYWRRVDDTDTRFEPAGLLRAEERLAAFPGGQRGVEYEFKIVAVGDGGRRAESDAVSAVSVAFGVPLTGVLSRSSAVVATAADGAGGDYSGVGGTFVLFMGGVEIVIGEGEDEPAFEVEGTPTGGLEIAIDPNTGVYTVTGLTDDGGQAVLLATLEGVEVRAIYVLAKAKAGADGEDGSNGSNGADGQNVARARIYRRATSTPSLPSNNVTFTFATGAMTGLNNSWTATVPAGTDPLYVSEATAAAAGASDIIAPGEWASPVVLVQNGSNGSNGADGLNSATVFLYQRAASAPSVPSGSLTYTFATGALSGTLGSWTQTVPAHDGNPLYVTTATALSASATDTIGTGEWATPRVMAQNGSNGSNGSNGADATSYWLVAPGAIKRNFAGVYTPTTITAEAKSKTGGAAPAAYAGRFIIAESTNGTSFTDVYTSASNESSRTHTPSAGIVAIRVRLYLAGGVSTLLDETIIPVVVEPPAPFLVSVAPTVDAQWHTGAGSYNSETIVASGADTYSWAYVSGDNTITIASPNTASTYFYATVGVGQTKTAWFEVTGIQSSTGATQKARVQITIAEGIQP